MLNQMNRSASFGEAVRLWFRIGWLSFGGAPAQIALLHKCVVDERHWINETDFLHALNFCMLLPGPEAHQLATYIGWRLHGIKGGLAAGILFVLPGAVVMLGLSLVYALLGHVPFVAALFFGLKAAVLAIVIEAVHRVAKRALKTRALAALSVIAFGLIGVLGVPFPALILSVALAAYGIAPSVPAAFGFSSVSQTSDGMPNIRFSTTVLTAIVCLSFWLAPLGLAIIVLGPDHRLVDIGVFFAKLAAVTFGGAYALLAWLAQAVVETKAWLQPNEMVDGLGLAETTPGPTILVTQFVGFLAAMRAPGTINPVFAGVLGACLTVWMTFAPSFLWIFTLAPYLEFLRTNGRLSAALAAISAVVVGVIAWVAFWFGLHVLFASVGEFVIGVIHFPTVIVSSVRPDAVLLAALAAIVLLGLRRGLAATLVITTSAGLFLYLALPLLLGFLQ